MLLKRKMETMKRGNWIVLWAVLNIFNVLNYCKAREEYCYSDDKDPYVQFGSKSAYEVVRAQKPQSAPNECKPVLVWGSVRHGTKYPSKETIEKMQTLTDVRDQILRNHEENREGELCFKDLQILREWKYFLSPVYENKLSTQGKDDLRSLPKRIRSQFSNVFDLNSPEKFKFYNDGSNATVESTEAFIYGLFGSDISSVSENSTLLMSSDTCNAWLNQVKNNSENTKEYTLFRQSNHTQNLISDVNRRLGFRNNLTLDVIELMYDMCRYEKAWYIGSKPPFCSVFTKRNLQVLEYMEDLHSYYVYGYGNRMNKKLACPLIKDMFDRFKEVADGKNKSPTKPPVGVFYFSDTGTHIPLLTFLGVKNDSQRLSHSNFELLSRREFMTSVIDPFSANLVAVFYKCITAEENRVMFYLNEHVVRLPECDVGLCSWSYLQNKFKNDVEEDSCNFDFCTNHQFDVTSSSFWTIFVVSMMVVILLIIVGIVLVRFYPKLSAFIPCSGGQAYQDTGKVPGTGS